MKIIALSHSASDPDKTLRQPGDARLSMRLGGNVADCSQNSGDLSGANGAYIGHVEKVLEEMAERLGRFLPHALARHPEEFDQAQLGGGSHAFPGLDG